MIFDHVGVLVFEIEAAKKEYFQLTNVTPTETIRVESQKVQISFVGPVELIEPDPKTPLASLRQRGIVHYHIAYRTSSFDSAVNQLLELKYFSLSDAFNSEVFENRRCQFFRNNLGHLIELVESPE